MDTLRAAIHPRALLLFVIFIFREYIKGKGKIKKNSVVPELQQTLCVASVRVVFVLCLLLRL
jgi:hypothetical protein